jgi:ATP-dependent Lon protease
MLALACRFAGLAKRDREAPAMDSILLPVFPLNLVLLPEQVLPLHIFEERYKQMIGECLKAKGQHPNREEFGIVLAQGEQMQGVGCTARIQRVVRQYPDGRMDILTLGKRRFEILYSNEEKAYLRCGVDFFDDERPDAPAKPKAARALKLFRQVADRLPQTSEEPLELRPPYRYLSFRLAASLPLEADFKQQLLSLRQEAQRLDKVTQAMTALIKELELSQRAQEKARGNGNLNRGVH